MRIGIDFDNTIVCFDSLFYEEAVKKNLIPKTTGRNKLAVRAALRSQGKEDAWTELQGFIYGAAISRAKPYEGVEEFFRQASKQKHELVIVSHKSTTPALGAPHDLHAAARGWLKNNKFSTDAFFETSISLKIERIKKLKCELFIDDLLEFLTNPAFPMQVDRILFSPAILQENIPFRQASSWKQIQNWLL